MDDLKRKIFVSGVFGMQLKNLTEDEFVKIYNNECYEITDANTRKKLKECFKITVLPSTKEFCKDKYPSTPIKDLHKILRRYYVRINLVEWKLIATRNLYNFKNNEYYLIFDHFVTAQTFVNIRDYKKRLDANMKKSFGKVICKLVKNGILAPKDCAKDMYRFVMYDEACNKNTEKENEDTNDLETENIEKLNTNNKSIDNAVGNELLNMNVILQNLQNKDKMMKYIKEKIDNNKNGILTSQIAEEFSIKTKVAYKYIRKAIDKDANYSFLTEVEGKVTRMRFLRTENMDVYKEKLLQPNTTHPVLLSANKLDVMRDLISKYRIRETGKDLYSEFATLINSKYIPDGKNFRKLAIKSGCIILQRPINDSTNKYFVCEKDVTEEELDHHIYKNQKPTQIKQKKQIEDKIFETFVGYDLLMAIDNGYKVNMNRRLKCHIGLLFEQMEKIVKSKEQLQDYEQSILNEARGFYLVKCYDKFRLCLIESPEVMTYLHQKIIKEKKIADLCQLVAYKYFLEDYKVKDAIYLRETQRAANFNKTRKFFDCTLDDLNHKNYSNYEALTLSATFSVKKLNDIFTEYTTLVYDADTSNCNLYIKYDKRLQFYDEVCKFDDSTNLDKIILYLDNNYTGEEYEAMYQRLIAYRKKITTSYRFFDREMTVPPRLHRLYEEMKKEFLNKRKIKIDEAKRFKASKKDFDDIVLNNCDLLDVTKVLDYLVKYKIITTDAKYYKVRKNVYKKINEYNVNTKFPLKFLYKINPDITNEYYSTFLPLVHFILIQTGTLKLEDLRHKTKFLQTFELQNLLETYKKYFYIEKLDEDIYVCLNVIDNT